MPYIAITDLDRIRDAIDPTGAIESYLWEEMDQPNAWESVGQIISQLEMASCAAGSWNGFIYTRDILGRLADSQWVEDIEKAIEEYQDATGETPTFDPYCSGFRLESVVTFAVDWVAHRLADKLRRLDHIAVVQAYSDSMDPKPDVIAFDTYWEACVWVAEEIERRVNYRVEHSSYAVSEEERTQWEEEESALIIIKDERL